MSCALTAENDAASRAPLRVARKRAFIMSTAPVGGRPIDAFVDTIRPHADRPPERSKPPKMVPHTHRDRRPGLARAQSNLSRHVVRTYAHHARRYSRSEEQAMNASSGPDDRAPKAPPGQSRLAVQMACRMIQ